MRISGENSLHPDAVKYYYELVARRGPEVPDAIRRHVLECPLCWAQICRLRESIVQTPGQAGSQRNRMDRDIIEILNLHFRCLGEPVTCGQVRPFLPGLLIPSLRIRIPTPITVHMDHCPECAEDLSVLRGFALRPGQLRRLERLYGSRGGVNTALCRQARQKIPAFAAASLDGIDAEILKHLCTCRQCRDRVREQRQKLLDGPLPQSAEAAAGRCDGVSMADLFDYVLTCDSAEEDNRADGAHVRGCRRCLERMQTLHQAIYGIAARADSGVATVYTTTEDAKDTPAADDPYPRHPINVQVLHRTPAPVVTRPSWPAATVATLSRTATNPRFKPWLKAAAVAAALLPLALLFLRTPGAAGITLAQVFKAFGRAQNVHISRFYPATGELLQEMWISRGGDFVLIGEGQERAFYDLGAKRKYFYSTPEASADVAELSDLEYANTRRLMDGSLGFTLRDVPADATWTRMEGNPIEGAEVYELAYRVQDQSGATVFLKHTIIIDPLTRLPQEIQDFYRLPTDDEWNAESKRVFEYPAESEMATIVGQ